MRERWKSIPEFPDYEVSDQGAIRYAEDHRLKTLSVNQFGVLHVMFHRNNQQYRRGVAGLVADAFLHYRKPEHFNALIHLSGNKADCRVSNLLWRPRWFSRKYHMQFLPGAARGFNEPVMEVKTGEVYPTSWEAATTFGLIDVEIKIAALNRTYVFPTNQFFRTLR
jgi:hypothetical protein